MGCAIWPVSSLANGGSVSRSVPEWIGKTPDEAIPPRVKVRVFERYHGVCQCGCKTTIRVGMKWEADHAVALVNGGDHRESNLVPLLVDHHKVKTAQDVAVKSKTYRMKAKNLGIRKRSSFACGRYSKWKKRVDGTVVPRAADT